MAFGISRDELEEWKNKVAAGKIAFITHFWQDPRFMDVTSVTKVGCNDLQKLVEWGHSYGLKREWIHNRNVYPHFDLLGEIQLKVLKAEGLHSHIQRFKIK
ncbi:hypothetical protein [Litchfieldia alkalitelluris]|uniref:hypothetical protein n=1 Tax=Litchfieldia alkalitelluris TaxID=304268 RepID=UPI000997C838|nr:hypothetical protein [Litchfieldia alkalitelluris]